MNARGGRVPPACDSAISAARVLALVALAAVVEEGERDDDSEDAGSGRVSFSRDCCWRWRISESRRSGSPPSNRLTKMSKSSA